MPIFRADEERNNGYERAREKLCRYLEPAERVSGRDMLLDIIDECGPVIDDYPEWHPLVSRPNFEWPMTKPHTEIGYQGLDHTVFFANGFVTCPYNDGQKVFESVDRLPNSSPFTTITAKRIEDVQLYHPNASPILVRCEWHVPLTIDGMIPKKFAVPLMLELELPNWRKASFAESWETMRPYFLGNPHGSRSSLFVNQESGQAMKRIWNALINTGMYGPIKV